MPKKVQISAYLYEDIKAFIDQQAKESRMPFTTYLNHHFGEMMKEREETRPWSEEIKEEYLKN